MKKIAKICSAEVLLRLGSAEKLSKSLTTYPNNADDVLIEVQHRIEKSQKATKFDLTALIGWKRVQNSPWMSQLYIMKAEDIEKATAAAFSGDIEDQLRIDQLKNLPGYRRGGAFTSVLFTAWDPRRYGVYDRYVNDVKKSDVAEKCDCNWNDLPIFWNHLRRISTELNSAPSNMTVWTPRKVDMAMFQLGMSNEWDAKYKKIKSFQSKNGKLPKHKNDLPRDLKTWYRKQQTQIKKFPYSFESNLIEQLKIIGIVAN